MTKSQLSEVSVHSLCGQANGSQITTVDNVLD